MLENLPQMLGVTLLRLSEARLIIQVRQERNCPVFFGMKDVSRKIGMYLKINQSLLYYFFLNVNIFLALLVRITCLGVLNLGCETQLRSRHSWRDGDTLGKRNI